MNEFWWARKTAKKERGHHICFWITRQPKRVSEHKRCPKNAPTFCTAPSSVPLTPCVSQANIANVPDCGAVYNKLKDGCDSILHQGSSVSVKQDIVRSAFHQIALHNGSKHIMSGH